jgi:cytochrome c-type biogenesis protein CcmH
MAQRPVSALLPRMLAALAASLLALAGPATAQTRPPADYANVQLRDPAKEAEAKALMETLRCLVCQGQSIADSDADMAGDMRSLVRQRIATGDNATQVRDWLVARYGDYVTYDPPMSAVTLPLWLTPIALLAIGIWIARSSFRRRRRRHK